MRTWLSLIGTPTRPYGSFSRYPEARLGLGPFTRLGPSGTPTRLYGNFIRASLEQPTTEQPAGGWANWIRFEQQRDRARRKREEEEDLADRIEAELAKAGLMEPAPEAEVRITVREFAHRPDVSRRTQRAVNYALQARTELAWHLAAREIAREEEDEVMALLMALALAA